MGRCALGAVDRFGAVEFAGPVALSELGIPPQVVGGVGCLWTLEVGALATRAAVEDVAVLAWKEVAVDLAVAGELTL